jgi:hypothetical protein
MDINSFSFLFPDRKKTSSRSFKKTASLILLFLCLLLFIGLKIYTHQKETPAEQPEPPPSGLMLEDAS